MSEAFELTLGKIKQQAEVLNDLDERAVELGVIIPLLRQLGWDTDNMREIYPQKRLMGGGKTDGDGKVDYALQINDKCLTVIEVKRWSHQLNEWDEKNQLEPYCRAAKASIAVLTNGRRWQFYRRPTSKTSGLRPFIHFDIANEPHEVEATLRKFLARNVVSNGSAVKLANSTLRDLQSREKVERAILDAVKTLSDSEDLRELLAARVEEDTGSRPTGETVEHFLKLYHVGLVFDHRNLEDRKPRPKPTSCIFRPPEKSPEPIPTKASWNTLLANLCLKMLQLHSDSFSDNLRKIPERFVIAKEEGFTPIGDTGWYVKFGDGNATKAILPKLLSAFGYAADSVAVKSKDGMVLYPDIPGANLA